ncbi:MAG: hypothetical protein HYV63_03460 [Candidatus Schekmanbacteria bacterium]|nr:hypothetical protein [Candidatus Schekmanbacteria bacterium]
MTPRPCARAMLASIFFLCLLLAVGGGPITASRAGAPRTGTPSGGGGPTRAVTVPAEAELVAGPWTLAREAGQPAESAVRFAPCTHEGRFWLQASSGASGASAVASAVVKLNGAIVLSPADFRAVPYAVARPVALVSGINELAVEARGKPGATLELSVLGIFDCGIEVELPEPPQGGYYMPPDPVRWGDEVFIEGRVKSSSPWWVELCRCTTSLGTCDPLEPEQLGSMEERAARWQGKENAMTLAKYCGPYPAPFSGASDLTEDSPWAGWWHDSVPDVFAWTEGPTDFAPQVGKDRFGVLIDTDATRTGYDRYAAVVFNRQGGKAFIPIPVRQHRDLGRRVSWSLVAWTIGTDPSWSRPPALTVSASLSCALADSSTRYDIDWNGDSISDLQIDCDEYNANYRAFGGIRHTYDEYGFYPATVVQYEDNVAHRHEIIVVENDEFARSRDPIYHRMTNTAEGER